MHKIGINLHAKAGLSDEAYIRTMHELGFEALFTDVLSEQATLFVIRLLRELGMKYEMIHAPFDGINEMWLDTARGERMLSRLQEAVDRAALAACEPVVVVHLSSGKTPPPINEVGGARYDRLVQYAAARGVRIAFENQRKREHLAFALARYAASANVGFCWDCGHEGCFTPDTQFMPLYGGKLLCTHIHDNACIDDADQHKLPFDGRLNFSRVARQLRESGYRGTLTLEVFAANSDCYAHLDCRAFLEQAAIAIKRLRRMVEGFAW